jgi:uncharacterized protein YndB with AHSA1/START domain
MDSLIQLKVQYQSSISDVWQALTDKEKMKIWYFDISDFELKEGSIFNFYEPGGTNQYHHRCKIEKIIPKKLLQHTWTHPSHSKGESMLTWNLTEIAPNITELTLTHEGIHHFADAGKDFVKENYEAGWNEILNQLLKNFLNNK